MASHLIWYNCLESCSQLHKESYWKLKVWGATLLQSSTSPSLEYLWYNNTTQDISKYFLLVWRLNGWSLWPLIVICLCINTCPIVLEFSLNFRQETQKNKRNISSMPKPQVYYTLKASNYFTFYYYVMDILCKHVLRWIYVIGLELFGYKW